MITMIKWNQTNRLSIKNTLSVSPTLRGRARPLSSEYGTRKSMLDSGLGFQAKGIKLFQIVPSSRGTWRARFRAKVEDVVDN